jgi:hypothetical protein
MPSCGNKKGAIPQLSKESLRQHGIIRRTILLLRGEKAGMREGIVGTRQLTPNKPALSIVTLFLELLCAAGILRD